jgi:UDP-N-acetylmuramyl pentapeptide synthase
VGEYARARGIAHVWTAGELCRYTAAAFGEQAQSFNSAADMVATVLTPSHAWPSVQSVLVKGSRFMKMETVVHALTGGKHAA